MATTTINIRTDSDIKERAQVLFAQFGMDMTTAVNLFLRQTLREQTIPFAITLHGGSTSHRANVSRPVGWEGKIEMAEDFDAPLEDFKDYSVHAEDAPRQRKKTS
jgi:DNA-damage-inducible protein J